MLESLDMTLKTDKKQYEKDLPKVQLRLLRLQQTVRERDIPVVLVFEGWDASGKGGAIKRLTEKLDPRGIAVHAIAAPTTEELAHHYLWRFWTRLPSRGGVCLFDRSWYGRVLVERVEKIAEETEWRRAYREINEFERMLADDRTVLAKFWVHITFEEQLKRFQERQDDPYKRWKITDEDWRNREKNDQYLAAVEDMLAQTHTAYGPWTLVEGDCKRYARLKTIHTVIDAIERALAEW